MRKGVTPVVATVLLMTVTIAASGTLYTIIQADIENQADNTGTTNIGLNTNSLNLETCYLESGKTNIVLRNNGRSAINASGLNMLLNNIQRDFTATPDVVNPQNTFTAEIDDQLGGTTDITFTNGETRKKLNCIMLPDGKPVRILSIGLQSRQSSGGSAPIPPDGDDSSYGGIYNAYNESNILPGARSYGVAAFNRTSESFIWKREYDIYEGGDGNGNGIVDGEENASRLANDLNALPNTEDIVVVVATADEPQNNRLANGLESAMYNIGASETIYGASNSEPGPFTYRSAYALVGSPNLTKGNAYLERYAGDADNDPDSWIDVTYEIETEQTD